MCVMLWGEVDCVVLFGFLVVVGFKVFILFSIEIKYFRVSKDVLFRK